MWNPVIKYNKPTISPTHHRKDIKILARVALRVFLKGRKPYNHCVFSVYTGIHQKIVSILECELDRVKEIIHYYKAAEKDRHIAVYDDFTIYDATLCWLDNPEDYCKTNQYPLWHP